MGVRKYGGVKIKAKKAPALKKPPASKPAKHILSHQKEYNKTWNDVDRAVRESMR